MIINSTRCATKGGHVGATRKHVLEGAENQHIEVLQGTPEELDDMVSDAEMGGSMYAVRHFTISPQVETSREDLMQVVDDLGREFNFDPADVLIVEHTKPRAGEAGFERHLHVLVAEYDVEIGRVMSSAYTHQREERIARIAEHRLGHPLIVGGHQQAVADYLREHGNDALAKKLEDAFAEQGRPRSSFTKDAHQAARRDGWSLPCQCRP